MGRIAVMGLLARVRELLGSDRVQSAVEIPKPPRISSDLWIMVACVSRDDRNVEYALSQVEDQL